jgi:hypothetical protein
MTAPAPLGSAAPAAFAPPAPPPLTPPAECLVRVGPELCLQRFHLITAAICTGVLLVLALLCIVWRCCVSRHRHLRRHRSRNDEDKTPQTPNNPTMPGQAAPSETPQPLVRTTTIRRQASGKVTIEAEEEQPTKPGALRA